MLLLALLAVAACLPGPVTGETGGEIRLEYSFNESHSEIYRQMLEQNASIGEYYEPVCPEFLESMPPETRAHVYDMPMSRHLASENRTFVPPERRVAIAIASPAISVCGVPVTPVTVGLAGIVILALLAAASLLRQRGRNRKE